MTTQTELATFAAGCFWGIETRFRQIEGVVDAAVGYIGGHQDNPTYRQVCTDTTGHAEAVQVEFDPNRVAYEDLLNVFWQCHNPKQVNRQGPDVGSQYRTEIFVHNDAQLAKAQAAKAEIEQRVGAVATRISRATTFWRAEEYHQQYHAKNGGTCGL